MCKLNLTKKYMLKILVLIIATCTLSTCEKKEEYASVTINGIEYAEIKTSNIIYSAPPSTIRIWEAYQVAEYYTILSPLDSDYPTFMIHFFVSMKDNSELEIDKPYKIGEIKLSEEFNLTSVIISLKDNLPDGYNGTAICQEEGKDEILLLEGEFKLERYDATTGYYHGSYHLTHTPKVNNNSLIIKGNFKAAEYKSQSTY